MRFFLHTAMVAVFLWQGWGVAWAAERATLEPDCTHLLLDRTHEWLFAHDAMSGRILPPKGIQVVVSEATLGTTVKPKDFDIVFIQQLWNHLDYSESHVRLLKSYVSEGGSLMIVGRPDLPIAKVATAFGCTLQPVSGTAPLRSAQWLVERYGAAKEPLTRNIFYTIRAAPGITPVLTDAHGALVAAKKSWGKGCVLLFADGGEYWDFNSYPQVKQRPSTVNDATTAALFLCLAKHQPRVKSPPPTIWIEPERTLVKDGLKIRFSADMEPHAQRILPEYRAVYGQLKEFTGTAPDRPLDLLLLATGAGGYCAFPTLGIGCMMDDIGMRGLLCWEMVNAWPLPAPPSFCEAWATFLLTDLPVRYGWKTAQDASDNWTNVERILRADDPKLNMFDIGIIDTLALPGHPSKDSTWGHFRMLKQGYMLHELSVRYGDDFTRRVVEMHAAMNDPQSSHITSNMAAFITEASLAVGENLTGYFRDKGTTTGSIDLPTDPVAVKAKATRLLADLARRRETERAQLKEYAAILPLLQRDDWAHAWRLEHNLVGDRKASWVETISHPPAHLGHLKVPTDPLHLTGNVLRHGYLVIHPQGPTNPVTLTRTIDVPATGSTRIYLGGMLRIGGSRVSLSFRIDGVHVWGKPLLRGMVPFHEVIDLSPYAGTTIALCLSADTQGEWGCREALLDYVTILHTPAGGGSPVML